MMRMDGGDDAALCGWEQQAAAQERATLACAEQLHSLCDSMLSDLAPVQTDDGVISRLRTEHDALQQQLASLEAQLESLSGSQHTTVDPGLQPAVAAASHAHHRTKHLTQAEVATAETDALRFLANNFSSEEDTEQMQQLDAVLSGDEAILRALDAGDTDRVNALLAALEEREPTVHAQDATCKGSDVNNAGDIRCTDDDEGGRQLVTFITAQAADVSAVENVEAEAKTGAEAHATCLSWEQLDDDSDGDDDDRALAMEREAEDTALAELMALVAQNPSALHSLPPGLQTILLDEVEQQCRSASGTAGTQTERRVEAHDDLGDGDRESGAAAHGRGGGGNSGGGGADGERTRGEQTSHFLMYGDSGGSAADVTPQTRRSEFMYRRSSFAERLAEYRAEQLSRASAEVPPPSVWHALEEAGGAQEGMGLQMYDTPEDASESEGEEGATGEPTEPLRRPSRGAVIMPPSSLFEAVERRDHAAMEVFIKQGWDVNEQNQYGETPLHVAVTGDDIQAVTILLAANACAELQLNLCGWTPLHKAAARGNLPIVKTLVAFGADVSHTKSDGLDAAAIAERNNHPHVQQYLEHWRHETKTPALPVMASLRLRCAVCIRRHFLQLQHIQVDELELPDALKLFVNGGVPFQRVRRLRQQQADKRSTPSPPAVDAHVAQHNTRSRSNSNSNSDDHNEIAATIAPADTPVPHASDRTSSSPSTSPSSSFPISMESWGGVGAALVAISAICAGGLLAMRWFQRA